MYIKKLCFLSILFSISCLSVCAQQDNFINPFPSEPLLSGNFGELRATHFHAGIDLRTGGVIGVPVHCVKDGTLARIKVSPSGYGLALYINHPDGHTSVYAHLDHTTKTITDIIHQKQYELEDFSIDIDATNYNITFKAGDIIAWSGNSGSSGGPHLHFEMRNTISEKILNPLNWINIKDNLAPMLKDVYIYIITKDGKVTRRTSKPTINIPTPRHYSCGRILVPSGNIGIGLYLSDMMNTSPGRLGTYEIEAFVDSVPYFHYIADTLDFNYKTYINEFKDYQIYRTHTQTVYRLFGNYIDRMETIKMLQNNGLVSIENNESKNILIKLKDINGNSSSITMTLCGRNSVLPQNTVLSYKNAHNLESDKYTVILKNNSLYSSVDSIMNIDSLSFGTTRKREVLTLAYEDTPLMQAAEIKIKGQFTPKSIICLLSPKNYLIPCTSTVSDSCITAQCSILGRYTVTADTTAPTIVYLGVSGGKLRFRIKDNLTGISTFRGEVNNKWCLFEYDAKYHLLTCKRTEPNFVKGKNNISVNVKDAVGNETVTTIQYYYK